MKLLSIIVPVYNVEAYLPDCLDSIFSQMDSHSDIEVIVVNDGSQDGSTTILEEYRKRYDSITVITQSNQGLSLARMNGLERAQGKYVWFVDSDDYLADHALEIILQLIQDPEAPSVIMTPIRWVGEEEGHVSFDYTIDNPRLMTGKDILFDPLFPQWLVSRYLISRSLFDNKSLYFPEGLIHEDEYFGSVLLMLAGEVLVYDKFLLNHRMRHGSIMQTISIRSSYDCISNYQQLKAFSETLPQAEQRLFLRHAQRLLQLSYVTNEKNWNTPGFRRFKREKGPYIISELLRNARSYTFQELASFLLLVIAPNTFRKYFPKQ